MAARSTLSKLFDAHDRRALLLAAAGTAVFFVLGILSPSTHNDDDLGRYMNTRHALTSLEHLVSLWNRPAFVLLYLLPAQLGYWAVELVTALVSGLTCFLTYRTARAMDLKFPELAIVLVAAQPFFLALSFSGLTEPLAACLLAASLLFLAQRRFIWSAVFMSWVPLARLELVLLFVPWTVLYLRHRAWKATLLLPAGLLVWNLAGFAHSGDPLFLYSQVVNEGDRIYRSVVWNHYLLGYIHVVGPVVYLLSILGWFDSLVRRRDLHLSIGVLLMLAAYTWLSSRSSAGQAAGFLRHVVAIAPMAALLGMRGVARWMRPSVFTVLASVAAAVVCGLFLSVQLQGGFRPGTTKEYSKLVVVGLLGLAACVLWVAQRRRGKLAQSGNAAQSERLTHGLAALLVILSIVFVGLRLPLIPLTHEQEVMRDVAEWVEANRPDAPRVLVSHPWFHFFAHSEPFEARFRTVRTDSLATSPPRSLVIWEGHYAHRLHSDLEIVTLENLHDWRFLERFAGSETGFFSVVSEKLPEDERRGYIAEGVFEHRGFGIRWGPLDPEWTWTILDTDLRLLRGTHSIGDAYLRVSRFFILAQPEQYASAIAQQLQKNPDITLAPRMDQIADWSVTWGQEKTRSFFVCTKDPKGRAETLQLSGYFAARDVEEIRATLMAWLPQIHYTR